MVETIGTKESVIGIGGMIRATTVQREVAATAILATTTVAAKKYLGTTRKIRMVKHTGKSGRDRGTAVMARAAKCYMMTAGAAIAIVVVRQKKRGTVVAADTNTRIIPLITETTISKIIIIQI